MFEEVDPIKSDDYSKQTLEADKRKLVIFMHIPKTGGTTLGNIIEKQYSKNVNCYIGNVLESGKEIQRNKDKIEQSDSLKGHFFFGIHRHLAIPFTYITMMRNPIERIISLYYYILREKQQKLHEKVKNISFEQFVNSKEYDFQTFNLQTRYFCGGSILDLETAKKNLNEHFSVVGITELFDDSVALMKKELGWNSFQYRTENVTKNRPLRNDFSKQTINKIIEKNSIDIELYNYAKKILINKLQRINL